MEASRTILIVDDLPLFREISSLFLARCGRVLCARNAEEGMEIARREKPDVVLVDLYMPNHDGVAMCEEIKADPALPNTSVIVMLATGDSHERARAIRAGADDVIAKPLSRVALIEAVNRYMSSVPTRGQPRIPLALSADVQFGDKDFSGVVRNISRGGIFLETDRSFAPGTELAVRFVLPDTRTPFETTAEVLWRKVDEDGRNRFGMGMRFVEIDGDSAQVLEEYIFIRATERTPSPEGARKR